MLNEVEVHRKLCSPLHKQTRQIGKNAIQLDHKSKLPTSQMNLSGQSTNNIDYGFASVRRYVQRVKVKLGESVGTSLVSVQ